MEQSAHYKYLRLLDLNKEHAALYFASKQPNKNIVIRCEINAKGDITEDNILRPICYKLDEMGLLEHLFSRDENVRGQRGKKVRIHFWKLTPKGEEVLAIYDKNFDDEIFRGMQVVEQRKDGRLL